MGYLHIENLYKARDVLLFKEVYALEKIHGTSAHVGWRDDKVRYFSGGASHTAFCALFEDAKLSHMFRELFGTKKVVLYGEAYGGKVQGMRKTYGESLRFIVFDVQIDGLWLSVPQAEAVAKTLRFEFVPYETILANPEDVDAEREKPSIQAVRNGILEPRKKEGIVLRPLIEVTKNNGDRVIAKHKHDDFRETSKSRELSDEKLAVLREAQAIADEWVTPMRMAHVLDKVQPQGIEDTAVVIKAVVADIEREAAGEIEMSVDARKAISTAAARMFKKGLQL